MRNILEIARQGEDRLSDDIKIAESVDLASLERFSATVKRFPRQQIETELDSGVKQAIGVYTLLLANRQVFELLRGAAVLEPIVYARTQGRRVMGMLSANYDEDGRNRLPTLKIIPLQRPYPLTSNQQPDARMATMLAGAVSIERAGVGDHSGLVSADPEHRSTMYGAISVDKPSIAISHKNHQVRRTNSVATGLTNGQLGNLFAPDYATSDFPGFGDPLEIRAEAVGPEDAIFIPESFVDGNNLESYGVIYDDAPRLMLGAGLQVLYERRGRSVSSQIQALSDQLA